MEVDRAHSQLHLLETMVSNNEVIPTELLASTVLTEMPSTPSRLEREGMRDVVAANAQDMIKNGKRCRGGKWLTLSPICLVQRHHLYGFGIVPLNDPLSEVCLEDIRCSIQHVGESRAELYRDERVSIPGGASRNGKMFGFGESKKRSLLYGSHHRPGGDA